jgi:hypothetical protein
VTVSLPLDTVAKLDAIAKNSLLMSRGRVIQAMVDEVLEVRQTIQNLQKTVQSTQNQRPQANVNEIAISVLLPLVVGVGDIDRRLSKFDASNAKTGAKG